jgi:hypothetical protein
MTPVDPNQKKPEDWTPEDALAVDSTPDGTRLHGDGDETDTAQRSDGAVIDPQVELDPDDTADEVDDS